MRTSQKIALLLAPIIYLVSYGATALPRESAVPGGVALINLSPTNSPKPTVHLGSREILVRSYNGQWQAVVGLSLKTPVGINTIKVATPEGREKQLPFKVAAKRYPETRITIQDDRKVNPYKDDMQRISAELQRSQHAFNLWSKPEPDVEFILPVSGRLSGNFGRRRIFNEQPRNPHSGMDIAAPTGTPVVSPAAGRVVETGDFFFNGKTIFIDHGQGVVTMYCHLDSIDVENGEMIDQGAQIATVGMTGRVTGPHLHWSVSLNGSRVDPELFMTAQSLEQLDAPNKLISKSK
jgi:murein DD-endopeptidase MepM/ murein hydrolase activator NlpD